MERHQADLFHVSSILLALCDASHDLHAERGARIQDVSLVYWFIWIRVEGIYFRTDLVDLNCQSDLLIQIAIQFDE